MNDFDRALRATLAYEGFYSDNPADPGGKTMRGIIQREYDVYRREKGLPTQWVKNISDAEVHDIYYNKYWLPVTQGRIWPLNAVMFDAAVNSGPRNAEWMLEQAKAQHPEYATLDNATRQRKLADAVIAVRRRFFRAIVSRRPASGVFLSGWLRRCDQLQQLCMQPASMPMSLLDTGLPDAVESDFTPRADDVDTSDLDLNAAV